MHHPTVSATHPPFQGVASTNPRMGATVCVCVSVWVTKSACGKSFEKEELWFSSINSPHHTMSKRSGVWRNRYQKYSRTLELAILFYCGQSDRFFFERDSIFMKTKHCTTWSKKTVSHKCIVQSETHATLMPYTKGENIKPVQRNFSALEIWLWQ